MKIAIISDQHFGVNGASEFFMGEYENFYNEVFFKSIDNEKPDAVVIPGDVWENRKYISPLTLKQAITQFFAPLSKRNIPIHIAYGNHDVYYKNTNFINSIDFLADMFPNIHVVKEAEKIGNFMLASWLCADNEAVIKEKLAKTDAKYLLGHFEINGMPMTVGADCTHGEDKSLFAKFDRVISGHFHVRSNDGKIFYTSNTHQTNWNDYKEEKGFHYFDDNSNILTPVNNPRKIYSILEWTEDTKYDDCHQEVEGKIVKIKIPSLATIDREKFSIFASKCIENAYKTSVVEVDNSEGKAEKVEIDDSVFISLETTVKDYIAKSVSKELIKQCEDIFFDIKKRAEGLDD